MSAIFDPQLPQGQQEPRVFNFPTPSNASEFVLGSDSDTTETSFTLTTDNTIIRMIEDQLATAVPQYTYEIRRDGFKIRSTFSSLVKDSAQPPWAGLPLKLRAGKYQFYMRQNVVGGGLAGRKLTVIFQTALV